MGFASAFAAAWMAVVGFFGLLLHEGPPPMPQGAEATTSVQQQPQGNLLRQGIDPGGPMIPASSNSQTSAAQTQTQTPAQPQPSQAQATAPASVSTSVSLPSGTPWQSTLTLGDNKYVTSAPKQGYIYLCHVATGGEGAQGDPTWISGNDWYPMQKVAVQGSVNWPNATYAMTVSGGMRIIKSNGLPTDHPTGTFPISRSDPAYEFDANPNTIQAQSYDYELPADPSMLAAPDCIDGEVGIMDDGVPLFDGFDAEYRDAVAHETQDKWDGHPDQTGVYHDHGFEDSLMQDTPVSSVVGFAFDGYPITGAKLPDGNYLTTADLDECHGITSTITLDGKSVTTYHYVLTQDFPYSVSCFRGTSYEPKPGAPSSSTSMGGMEMGSQTNVNASAGSGTQSQGSAPTPPEAAISACASLSSGSSCSMSGAQGSMSGTCMAPPGTSQLACIPANR